MAKAASHILFFTISALTMAGCSSYRGGWPVLGTSDQSDASFQQQSAADLMQGEVTESLPINPLSASESAARLKAITGRISEKRRSYSQLKYSYDQQQKRVETARQSAGRARATRSVDWSTTQFELTRLGQISESLAQLKADLNLLAGDLASLSAQAANVDKPLALLGGLIIETDKKLSEAAVYRKEITLLMRDAPRP